MKGVILAAGKGTRMRPLTNRRPKPLVPVLDRPMLEHIIAGAGRAGVSEIAIIVGYLGEQVIEHFGERGPADTKLHYIWQEEAKGTGHATLLAEDFVDGEPFFMSWGDIIVPPRNYPRVVNAFERDGPHCVLSLNYVEDPYEGAAVYVDNGYVTKIVEKPPKGASTTNFNNAGLFVHRPELFDRLRSLEPSDRGEIELPDAIQQMVVEGKQVRAVELEGYWSDVARPGEVIRLNETIMQYAYSDRDNVYIAPGAEVSEDCVIEPPVCVGPGCSANGATLGPNATLVGNCRVEPDAELSHMVALHGAHVGQGAELKHCIVEERYQVGQGHVSEGTADAPAIVGKGAQPPGNA